MNYLSAGSRSTLISAGGVTISESPAEGQLADGTIHPGIDLMCANILA